MNVQKVDLNKLKQNHWTSSEMKNAEIITDFVQHLMNNHDFDYVKNKFGQHKYIQHNLSMIDGMPGVITFVSDFAKRFPDYMYDVKYILASGDMILFHSHVTTKVKNRGNQKKGFIITDRWKIVDGEISEHWDTIQPINSFFRFYIWLTGGKIQNSNGLF